MYSSCEAAARLRLVPAHTALSPLMYALTAYTSLTEASPYLFAPCLYGPLYTLYKLSPLI